MKVLFVITDINMGGAEIQLYRMCKYFSEQTNDELHLVSLMTPESEVLMDMFARCGVRIFSLDMLRGQASLNAYRKFIKIVKQVKPDVIHAHMIHANLLTRLSRPFLGKVVVINTIHGEEEYKGKRRLLYRLTTFLADYTVACGKMLYNQALEYKIGSDKKLKYIYNVLDLNEYQYDKETRETVRNDLNLNKNFVWMTVARLSEVKNQRYLIKEFSNLSSKRLDVRLVIVGDGPLKDDLHALVKEEGLEDKVLFLGNRDDVRNLLCGADAFVLSSVHEGLPLSLQEAGALELPLVSTDVGGCNEIIKNGENGFLCNSNEPKALENAMLALMMMGDEERQEMGKISRKVVEAKFSMDRNMEMWRNLYKKCE